MKDIVISGDALVWLRAELLGAVKYGVLVAGLAGGFTSWQHGDLSDTAKSLPVEVGKDGAVPGLVMALAMMLAKRNQTGGAAAIDEEAIVRVAGPAIRAALRELEARGVPPANPTKE